MLCSEPRLPIGFAKYLNEQVQFSPDGRYLVSASFDKSVKLWDGLKGTFVGTFRGHVGPVYQVSWSSDSRLLVSGSKDSTLKVSKAVLNCLMCFFGVSMPYCYAMLVNRDIYQRLSNRCHPDWTPTML